MAPDTQPLLSDEAAALLREAADSLPVLISYVDADERYRFVNHAYTEWFGGRREDFIGRSLREVLGDDAYSTVHPHVQAALQGKAVRFDARATYRSGEPRDIDASYSPRRDVGGNVVGFYVLVQDISARKAAEAASAQSQARLSDVLETVSDGFLALDRQWRLTVFNHASEAFLDAPRSDVLGRSVWEVFPQLLGSPFEPLLHAAMAGGSPAPLEAASVARADRRVLARATPAPDGVTVIFTDITERWIAEQARNASEAAAREQLEELEAVYKGSPVGLAFLTNDLRFVRVNHRLAAMNGVPADDHVGRTVREVVPAIADDIDAIKARLDGGETVVSFEISGETHAAPGVLRHWLEYWTPLRAGDGTVRGLAVAVEEITDRKAAESQTRLLIDELNHRVKNTLSVVQNIARQTLKGEALSAAARDAFEARLLALASAHNVLTESRWTAASLHEVAEGALGGEAGGRVRLFGEPVALSPDVAVTLSLALHELSTNARKYGALSTQGGFVDLSWSYEGDLIRLLWREHGGPRVAPPTRRGFGVRLLDRAMDSVEGGSVRLTFDPGGVACALTFPKALSAKPADLA